MKVLFISPPATSYIEPRAYNERNLEVALPRIPFDVLAYIDDSIGRRVLDIDWELDKHPDSDYREIIAREIRNYGPDVVLSSIFAQSMTDTVDQITTAVKEEDSNVYIVVGGQAIPH